MRDARTLAGELARIDGRGYKAYKAFQGGWTFADFELHIDHVQGDPFAEPSRVRVLIGPDVAGLAPSAHASPERALGTAAFLASAFAASAVAVRAEAGTGRSGEIRMEDPGQKVLNQTAVRVEADGGVEARFTVGLPASGRRVLGKAAARLMTEVVPTLIRETLLAASHQPDAIELAAAANEDAEALRAMLADEGLVGFVADGSRLPRRSGIDDRPLAGDDVVPFTAPPSLSVEVEVPNAGRVRGMGVPTGVTLIVGGGFHGKSTLLRALEAGVYNHRPHDGRELVVARADTVKVRAEDGRSVAGVDISPFIDGLPGQGDTSSFSTPNASGSTSQAATIVEALEAGAGSLLMDEDTSATNFMIRDHRMQQLVPREGEPITPFVDRVRSLTDELGVSAVLVIGGSGDYLDVADTVVRMDAYRPVDVTQRARAVAEDNPTGRTTEAGAPLTSPRPRKIRPDSIDARRGKRERYVRVPDERTLLLGRETVDLVAVEQLASRAQTRAIGHALALVARRSADAELSVADALDHIDELLDSDGLDALESRLTGDKARFRRFELAAALNRLRSLRVV